MFRLEGTRFCPKPVNLSWIVPRCVVYESVISGSVGLAQLTTAESRVD